MAHRARLLMRLLRRNPVTALLVKVVVTVVGMLVLAVGVLMLVTPGPAFVVIPAGLALLATEWPWARRALDGGKRHVRRLLRRLTAGRYRR